MANGYAKDGSYPRGVNLPTFQYMTSAPTNYEMIDAQNSLNFLANRGWNLVRIPIPWGRIQPALGGPLDGVYFPKLQTLVNRCGIAGLKVVLDLHCAGGWNPNGGDRFSTSGYTNVFYNSANGGSLGSAAAISQAQFVDFWNRIDAVFQNNAIVLAYDLCNEPYTNSGPRGDTIPQATYRQFMQAVVTALRANGCQKDIWIEGTNSSQPQGWNAREGAAWITDTLDDGSGFHTPKIVYSFHTYPLSNGNGDGEYNAGDGNTSTYLARIDEFETWRAAQNVRASCGETGWPSQQRGAPTTFAQYNTLAESWLDKADTYGYAITTWQAHAAQEEGFNMYVPSTIAFTTPTPTLSVARTNAVKYEEHPPKAASGGGGGGGGGIPGVIPAVWDLEPGDFSQFTSQEYSRSPGTTPVNTVGDSELAIVSADLRAKILALTTPAFLYTLGGTSGTETDEAGHSNGTLNGTPARGEHAVVPGDSHASIYFDGVDDWMTAPFHSSMQVGNTFTCIAWLRPDQVATAMQLFTRDTGSISFQIAAGGTLRLSQRGSSTVLDSVSLVPVDGRPHMLVITKSGTAAGSAKAYIDGVDAGDSIGLSYDFGAATTGGLFVGQDNAGGKLLKGHAGFVALLPIALTAAQVLDLWKTGPVRQGTKSMRVRTYPQPAGATNTDTHAIAIDATADKVRAYEGETWFYKISVFIPGIQASVGATPQQTWPAMAVGKGLLMLTKNADFSNFQTQLLGIETLESVTSPKFYVRTFTGNRSAPVQDVYNAFQTIAYDTWQDFIYKVKWSTVKANGLIGIYDGTGAAIVADFAAQTLDPTTPNNQRIDFGFNSSLANPPFNSLFLDSMHRFASLADAVAGVESSAPSANAEAWGRTVF